MARYTAVYYATFLANLSVWAEFTVILNQGWGRGSLGGVLNFVH